MTEHIWFNSRVPMHALNFLAKTASERKRRLFAVACCRRIERLILQYQGAYRAVVLGERIADGEEPSTEARELGMRLTAHAFNLIDGYREEKQNNVLWNAARAAACCVAGLGPVPWYYGPQVAVEDGAACAAAAVGHEARKNDTSPLCQNAREMESAAQMQLIDCMFGNPFHPVAFNSAWRTDTAVAVARQMYDSRDFGAMPILADALQDAGCEDEQVLAHCREPGPHVRGCWVCDAVLGFA